MSRGWPRKRGEKQRFSSLGKLGTIRLEKLLIANELCGFILMKGRTQPLIVVGIVTALIPTTILFVSVTYLFVVPLITGLACLFWGNCQATNAQQGRRLVIGAFACVVASVAPFVSIYVSQTPARPIKIIVPDGFRGQFQIVKDSKNGQELVIRDGAYVFEIPPSGILRVRSDRPFYRPHTTTVEYRNGTEVRAKDLGTTIGTRRIGENSWESSTEFDGTTHRWNIP